MIEDSKGSIYTFEDGRWQGDNDRVVKLLNERIDLLEDDNPASVLPDPIGFVLEDAAKLLKGRVIERPELNFVEGRVY